MYCQAFNRVNDSIKNPSEQQSDDISAFSTTETLLSAYLTILTTTPCDVTKDFVYQALDKISHLNDETKEYMLELLLFNIHDKLRQSNTPIAFDLDVLAQEMKLHISEFVALFRRFSKATVTTDTALIRHYLLSRAYQTKHNDPSLATLALNNLYQQCVPA
jgi:hypothetical protein